jgi:riboflavin kinase/FMN adenylyltransferase
MDVVPGIEALRPEHGPAFVVVGVFDGLHLGHRYLLEHLATEADARAARPVVVTFDHHPDEILTGSAPPLLLDPDERLERLAEAGVGVTVVQPFDAALRETPYDAFVERIRDRVDLVGFLMTPDAAFGFERRGTPEALAALGAVDGFEVVVIPPFDLGGRPVRSSEIRTAIAAGDLRSAATLLGRPVTLTGRTEPSADGHGKDGQRLTFELPMATPPDGTYRARVAGSETTLEIRDGEVRLRHYTGTGRVTCELLPA